MIASNANMEQEGYTNGKMGIPAPAPGFASTRKRREDYMRGWRRGRDEYRKAAGER